MHGVKGLGTERVNDVLLGPIGIFGGHCEG
jgi:hypothetical protein